MFAFYEGQKVQIVNDIKYILAIKKIGKGEFPLYIFHGDIGIVDTIADSFLYIIWNDFTNANLVHESKVRPLTAFDIIKRRLR